MRKFLMFLCMLFALFGNAFAQKQYDTELVVVGSGVAGLTAAAYASDQGVKTILLEKLPNVGGQLIIIEGTFAVETKTQRQDMVGLTKDEAFNQIMDYSGWRANAAYNKKYVDNSASTLEWLQKKGVEMEGVTTDTPDGNRVYHMYKSGFPGKNYIDSMMKVIKENNNIVLTETPAKSLITDKKGNVTGVIAENADGEEIRVNAKAVLLATGSFVNNAEILQKYNPELVKGIKHISPLKNMGDGIVMGQKIGADVANMNTMIFESAVPVNMDYHEIHDNPARLDAYMILKTPSIWLNKNGKRFVNEALSGDYTVVSNSLVANGSELVVIMDEEIRKDIMFGAGSHANYFTLYDRGQLVKHFDEAVQDGMKKGYAFKANSIEELAKKMNMDVAIVKASVERYNKLAEKGEDVDFGKDAAQLKPITHAPYYGFIGMNTICDAAGGLKIDENAQVINTEGYNIPGLYAAGATTGGMYGTNYPYIMPGYASGSAMNAGRFAVEHVMKTILHRQVKSF